MKNRQLQKWVLDIKSTIIEGRQPRSHEARAKASPVFWTISS